MRGKVECSPSKLYPKRITPAYAGKSAGSVQSIRFDRDHPRLCGEKLLYSSCPIIRKGSPPPMRGKVLLNLRGRQHFRITPAYAGKSEIVRFLLHVVRDHPRLCGEKLRLRGCEIF